jgi:hypothetical protein
MLKVWSERGNATREQWRSHPPPAATLSRSDGPYPLRAPDIFDTRGLFYLTLVSSVWFSRRKIASFVEWNATKEGKRLSLTISSILALLGMELLVGINAVREQ